MKKSTEKLIAFLENYNRWRRGSYLHDQPVPEELGQCLDQAVEMLKSMTWQPMETAPKDREFLGVWGPKDPPPGEAFDVFIYDEDRKRFTFSGYGDHIYLPIETYGPWAWMEIPKYEL